MKGSGGRNNRGMDDCFGGEKLAFLSKLKWKPEENGHKMRVAVPNIYVLWAFRILHRPGLRVSKIFKKYVVLCWSLELNCCSSLIRALMKSRAGASGRNRFCRWGRQHSGVQFPFWQRIEKRGSSTEGIHYYRRFVNITYWISCEQRFSRNIQ